MVFGDFQGRSLGAVIVIGGYDCGPSRSTVGARGLTIQEGKGTEVSKIPKTQILQKQFWQSFRI